MPARALDFAVPSTHGNSFITDIAQRFLLDDDPWLPTSAWVTMLVALGLPAATARSSLHRMQRGGWLERLSRGSVPGYEMSERWRAFAHEWPQMSAPDLERQSRWTLVAFSIPESRRDLRHLLRTELSRAGMASLGNGVWIGPEVTAPSLAHVLAEAQLTGFVDMFLADYQGFREDEVALANRCWDLKAAQRAFADLERDVARRLELRDVREEQAFVDVVTTLNSARLLQRDAPRLPTRMFPPGGSRAAAQAAVDRLLAARLPGAQAWVSSLRSR